MIDLIVLILIGAVIYGVVKWVKTNIAIILIVIGLILSAYIVYRLCEHFAEKAERERKRKAEEEQKRILDEKYRQPLTDEEIIQLSEARRNKGINEEFAFTHSIVTANPAFRSSLNVEGRWDRINEDLIDMPSLLADVLRYKRHEWYIWCLADNRTCKLIWANKGDDNSSCYYKGNILELVSLAASAECSTVLCMHNHPHTQERWWDLLEPSDTDLESFERMSTLFEASGLKYIDALCSQGKFRIYGYSIPDDYWPDGSRIEDVVAENSISEDGNRKLHIELDKIIDTDINIL